MVPDHRINAIITMITKLSLIHAYPSATSARGSGLLLDPASAALLAVYYVFPCEATRKISKAIIILVIRLVTSPSEMNL
jgi:hypothetical protein